MQELVCERIPQSISQECVEAEAEFVAYADPLPYKFADYSLLSVEDKVKCYQITGKEDTYSM